MESVHSNDVIEDLAVRPNNLSHSAVDPVHRCLKNTSPTVQSRQFGPRCMSSRSDTVLEPVYLDFEELDPRNPRHFPKSQKWAITLTGCLFTILASATSSAYTLGYPSMTRDLHTSVFKANIGLSVYALGFGLFPLVTTSFSEEVGRRPLYIVFLFGLTMTFLLTAMAPNIDTVIGARLLAGGFASTGATMVGGTISDLFEANDRGLPMSIYAFCALGAVGIGPAAAGWVEMNPDLGWKWIEWILMILSGVVWLMAIAVMKETRESIILIRLAKQKRNESGDDRIRARGEDERSNITTLLYVSCTRPLYLLFTEPIVASFSIWLGFAWGVFYSMIESIAPIFKDLHHFNQGEVGVAFLTMFVGAFFGFLANLYYDTIYKMNAPARGPEARLYGACAAAVFLPAGLFIYAWTSFEFITYWAMLTGIVIFIAATLIIYLAAFNYLADCYGPYASSTMAGQSLFRNLMGAVFPLFASQMFANLTYKWAQTLFALVAVILIPIPYVLFQFGPGIRKRSKFSSSLTLIEAKPWKDSA